MNTSSYILVLLVIFTRSCMLIKFNPLSLSILSGQMCFFSTKIKDITDCPFFPACLSHYNKSPTVQYLKIFHCNLRAISRKLKPILAYSIQIYICVLLVQKFFQQLVWVEGFRIDKKTRIIFFFHFCSCKKSLV